MIHRVAPVLLLAGSICLAVSGCDQKKAPAPASSAQPVTATSAKRKPPIKKRPPMLDRLTRGRLGKSGPAGMLLRAALRDPSLKDEQRTKLEALRDQMRLANPRGRQARGDDFRKALAEAAKAGKVDEKAFEKPFEDMAKAKENKAAVRTKHLNALHAALEPAQRKAVVASVRKKMESGSKMSGKGGVVTPGGPKIGMHPEKGPKDLAKKGPGGPKMGRHPEKGPNRLEKKGPGARPVGMHRKGRGGKEFGFVNLARGLKLTDAQQKKLDALTKKLEAARPSEEDRAKRREESKKKLTALLDAFEKDEFDASNVAFTVPVKDRSTWMKSHLAHFSEFLQILTEEQRGQLATRLASPSRDVPQYAPEAEIEALTDDLERTRPAK